MPVVDSVTTFSFSCSLMRPILASARRAANPLTVRRIWPSQGRVCWSAGSAAECAFGGTGCARRRRSCTQARGDGRRVEQAFRREPREAPRGPRSAVKQATKCVPHLPFVTHDDVW
ncbi:hypothetical protein GCM10009750_14340 [Agromyces salentinus]|uniref:Uncharacterized protein n=1 Tax=Agromyces salentinus TaxID=269421 RepID=A0ABP4YXP0_9MICO